MSRNRNVFHFISRPFVHWDGEERSRNIRLTIANGAIRNLADGRTGKPVTLVVNKTDGIDVDAALAEFHRLGMGEPRPISAAHGRGVEKLLSAAMADVPLPQGAAAGEAGPDETIRVAVVGRPNVGKSTLINRILGEERVLAYDLPGTTRDSIFIPFERDGCAYTLIDTAGVRRRKNVKQVVEKFSIVKTLKAIDDAHVVVLVMDAHEGIVDQDMHLLGHYIDAGRGLVLADSKAAKSDVCSMSLTIRYCAVVANARLVRGASTG